MRVRRFLVLVMFFLPVALPGLEPDRALPPKRWAELQARARAVGSAGEQAARLLACRDEEELELALLALGRVCARGKGAGASAAAIFDELRARRDPRADVIAAELLLQTVGVGKVGSFAPAPQILDFPAELCERAAGLLGDPNPVVQAMGEWTLALRVKKQGASVKRMDQLFRPRPADLRWHRAWSARPPSRRLEDDYARQLVQLNLHRGLAGLRSANEALHERLRRLLDDPGSRRPPAAALDGYAEALAEARRRAEGPESGLAGAHRAHVALRVAGRGLVEAARTEFPTEGFVFHTARAIPGGVWNVNVPVTGDTNIPGGDIWVRRSADPASEGVALLRGALGDGSLSGLDLDWEGRDLLFSFWQQPVDPAAKPRGWRLGNARLYRLALGGGEPRGLPAKAGHNDIEPSFLPDGGYVFASDRSGFGNQCAGPFLQDKRCTTLFRLAPEAGAEPVAISNNKDFDRQPHVLNDGTVVFLHWEYQERGLYETHAVWRCRPDGSGMDAFFKQHLSRPMSIRDVGPVPESELCVGTAQGHHDGHNGPVLLFDPGRGINAADTMLLVTPGVGPIEGGLGPLAGRTVPEGGVANRGGSYINPFALSARAFLVGHDLTNTEADFAVYYIDVWGNRELLHRDPEYSCVSPHPLRPRPRPPVVADVAKPGQDHALAFVENVYRDLPGVEPGAVKYLRLSQSLPLPAPVEESDPRHRFNHLHWLPGDATTSHFSYWSWSPSRTIGLVRVAEDGSAYFKVPAGTPIYLQALDARYLEVRRMRSSFTLQRGEFRGCAGCHESRPESAGTATRYPRETFAAGPQTPEAPPWGGDTVLDYRRHIQPIFDRACGSCHGERAPAGGLDLSAREIGGFAQSYRSLFGLKPGDPTPVRAMEYHLALHPEAKGARYVSDRAAAPIHQRMQQNRQPGQLVWISDRLSGAEITEPRQFGSGRSPLILRLLDPQDATHRDLPRKIGRDGWLALVTWIDHNANYHSTLMDKTSYARDRQIRRVPYELPSIWIPGDRAPLYLNRANLRLVSSGGPDPEPLPELVPEEETEP
jgi:hypothetical protein